MKLVNRFALLLFASVALFSCSEDDAPVPVAPDNKFSVDGDIYKIASGAFLREIEPGTDDNGNEYYRNELIMVEEGITLTEVDGKLTGTGEGSRVILMINNEGREIQAGTYTWQSEDNEQPFDLWAGYIKIWENESEVSYDLASGTLTITKSGSTYKAAFEGIAFQEDEDQVIIPGSEVPVSFQYEGSLFQADLEQ